MTAAIITFPHARAEPVPTPEPEPGAVAFELDGWRYAWLRAVAAGQGCSVDALARAIVSDVIDDDRRESGN